MSAWGGGAGRQRGPRDRLFLAAVFVLLFWAVVYPNLVVLAGSLRGDAGLTTRHYAAFFGTASELRALWSSVWISALTVMFSALIGVPLALLFARYEFPGRRLLGALAAMPVLLPPLVGVIAILFLYGESGIATRLVQDFLGLESPPWRLHGAGAILAVHAYSMYVYFYLFTLAGLARLDPAVFEAAASLGAGRIRTFGRVTLPLLTPTLAGASLLTFMTSMASFSAPYVLGGGFRVMTTQIFNSKLQGEMGMAMVETVMLAAVSLMVLWPLSRWEGSREYVSPGKGAAPQRLPVKSRWAAVGVPAAAGFGVFLLILPHLTLLLVSLVPDGSWTVQTLPPRYSLENYAQLFSELRTFRPIVNSLLMASAATFIAVAFALAVGQLVVRWRVPGRRLLEAMLAVPWALPGTVLAVALATTFSVSQPWAGRFVLVGTAWILVMAYALRVLPLTGRAVLAGYRQLDPSFEEAAASLGAGRWRTLRRVTIPALLPAIAAGASLAFVTGLGEFVASIVLYTHRTRPISIEILAQLRDFDLGAAAAYGVLLMVLVAGAFTLAQRWIQGERAKAS
ncbi:MAG: iron ABC transporter permease [Gemmatimonadota bacterium]|nr:MAG: iron ABC transporter permease [Gemmatimonadota bacterium]